MTQPIHLTQRLDQLERRLRRWQGMVVALAVLLGVAILAAQRAPRPSTGGILPVVRTKKLLVYNDQNQIVYMVGSDRASGKGTWQLIHEKRPVVGCFPGKWGGSIQLSQQGDEKTGLLLVGDRNGFGSAVIWDGNKQMKWQAP